MEYIYYYLFGSLFTIIGYFIGYKIYGMYMKIRKLLQTINNNINNLSIDEQNNILNINNSFLNKLLNGKDINKKTFYDEKKKYIYKNTKPSMNQLTDYNQMQNNQMPSNQMLDNNITNKNISINNIIKSTKIKDNKIIKPKKNKKIILEDEVINPDNITTVEF